MFLAFDNLLKTGSNQGNTITHILKFSILKTSSQTCTWRRKCVLSLLPRMMNCGRFHIHTQTQERTYTCGGHIGCKNRRGVEKYCRESTTHALIIGCTVETLIFNVRSHLLLWICIWDLINLVQVCCFIWDLLTI